MKSTGWSSVFGFLRVLAEAEQVEAEGHAVICGD